MQSLLQSKQIFFLGEIDKLILKFVCKYRRPGEGNGTPLQYSCLENPMDGEASWAAVSGVAQSRTQLK